LGEGLALDPAVLDYLRARQCVAQWRDVLHALGEEFSQHLPPADLRRVMRRVGRRFAESVPLPDCRDLADLQIAMNNVWHRTDWGWVILQESADTLLIEHKASPLAAFGRDASDWSPALLEGIYERWFEALGAGDRLTVSQGGDLDDSGSVVFRFGPAGPLPRADKKPPPAPSAGWRFGGRWSRGAAHE